MERDLKEEVKQEEKLMSNAAENSISQVSEVKVAKKSKIKLGKKKKGKEIFKLNFRTDNRPNKKQHLKSSIEVSSVNNKLDLKNQDDQVIKKTKFFKDKDVRITRVAKSSKKPPFSPFRGNSRSGSRRCRF